MFGALSLVVRNPSLHWDGVAGSDRHLTILYGHAVGWDVIVKEAPTGHPRRLHQVFGDVLPDSTADDRPDDRGDEEPDARDRWLRDNRPPHHDPAP
jgi:hypothetical protein